MTETPGSSSSSRQDVRQMSSSDNQSNWNNQMFPVTSPGLLPTVSENSETNNRGAGVYVVPVAHPFWGSFGMPPHDLIPLAFNIPTRPNAEDGNANASSAQQPPQPHEAGPHRQAVRRFPIAFQIDLMLIIKLAAVIVLFNQDGSRQRLFVLVICAAIVYLYQTGALAPLIRWLSESMQVAPAPPRNPQQALRPENAPLIQRQNENAAQREGQAVEPGEDHHPEGDGQQGGEHENLNVGGADNRVNQRWGFVREIQMIVLGFIASLLPGFHNAD